MTTNLLNTNTGEVENKIPYNNCLVTATVPNTKIREVENKFQDVNSLVKKIVYNAKISNIDKNYFNTFDYNDFKCGILDLKIK